MSCPSGCVRVFLTLPRSALRYPLKEGWIDVRPLHHLHDVPVGILSGQFQLAGGHHHDVQARYLLVGSIRGLKPVDAWKAKIYQQEVRCRLAECFQRFLA